MNKRSLLSLCGLAPVAALAPITFARSGPVYGERISGTVGVSALQLDTSEIIATLEAECAKFEAKLGSVREVPGLFVRSQGEIEWRPSRMLEWSNTIPDRFAVPDR